VNEDKASRYHRLRRRAELSATSLAGIFLFALLVSGGSLMLREYASMGASVFPAGFEEQGTVIVFALSDRAAFFVLPGVLARASL
jgi:hypothetical protein